MKMLNMKTRIGFVTILALALTLPVATLIVAQQAGAGRNGSPPRPQGPCDIYSAGGTPCVAAHSTTRALYASYNGPLYQVMRKSDGKTQDIGIMPTGIANAAKATTLLKRRREHLKARQKVSTIIYL